MYNMKNKCTIMQLEWIDTTYSIETEYNIMCVFINSQAMPHLAWDATTLVSPTIISCSIKKLCNQCQLMVKHMDWDDRPTNTFYHLMLQPIVDMWHKCSASERHAGNQPTTSASSLAYAVHVLHLWGLWWLVACGLWLKCRKKNRKTESCTGKLNSAAIHQLHYLCYCPVAHSSST